MSTFAAILCFSAALYFGVVAVRDKYSSNDMLIALKAANPLSILFIRCALVVALVWLGVWLVQP